ncbi:beta-1,3-glucan-binding protein-like isoform X2 [Condylostylus longicornis]|uniref:beta-1,3-glucan-binding protein-like isoform X2 n=1 Tax=Condylostylus longicornis TaxID=2530218 RepID=UPI00244E535B|nr:beta-1,3-glucan-binding protein-like isoform X2 [Condylostylus longicornis]
MIKNLLFFTFLLSFNVIESANQFHGYAKRCKKSPTTAFGTKSKGDAFCSNQLIFEDNFDNLDLGKWKQEITLGGGGNWEFQWYVNNKTNAFAKNGLLHIHPTFTSDVFGEDFLSSGVAEIPPDQCTNPAFNGCKREGTPANIINPIRSARLETSESFNFKYGKLEVRAKIPTGDWLWPAIWLLPKRNFYGTWPTSGEIDLLESRGNRNLILNGVNIGVEQFGSTLHYGPDPAHNGWENAHFVRQSQKGRGFNEDFHKYTLLWSPEYFIFSIDDQEIGRIDAGKGFFQRGGFPNNIDNPWIGGSKMAPFDQELVVRMVSFLILHKILVPSHGQIHHRKHRLISGMIAQIGTKLGMRKKVTSKLITFASMRCKNIKII